MMSKSNEPGNRTAAGGQVEQLVSLLPRHDCELSITHNGYKSCYEDLSDAVDDIGDAWVSDAEKESALKTGEIWEMQWYPDTPIGFYRVAASTLDGVILAASNAR